MMGLVNINTIKGENEYSKTGRQLVVLPNPAYRPGRVETQS